MRGDLLRRFGPATYLVIAIVVGLLFLPSALRPPPEQTNDSAALSPDAPPDDQAEQILQTLEQAKGGGAGAIAGQGSGGATGDAPPPDAPTTTSTTAKPGPPAKSRCFGDPPRQIPSVYSAPCAPGFSGDNGGATGHNVFPNEIRIGSWHSSSAPTAGRIPDTAPSGESAVDRTMRVLAAYFNQHYQTWGRRVVMYGMKESGTIETQQAEAARADTEDKLFAANYLHRGMCEDFVRRGNIGMCGPNRHEVYLRHRPGLFSFMTDRTQAMGFGAEYVCKKLVGKPPDYAGNVFSKTDPRKFAIVSENTPTDGMPPSVFTDLFQRECGGTVDDRFELTDRNQVDAATQAVAKMQADHITTVVLDTVVYNAIYLMTAAQQINWEPEWVQFNANGLDFNNVPRLLPTSQAAHLFGLSAWEAPRPPAETECYQAYRTIDPANEPDAATCKLHWHPLVMIMNGIQEAGPKLTQASFDSALLKLGRHFPPEPWAIGGGFGPDDFSYMDDMAEIWWSGSAVAPDPEALGAYRWTAKGRRYKRGEIPRDTAELFKKGVTYIGGAES
jgi:hypothetical protein